MPTDKNPILEKAKGTLRKAKEAEITRIANLAEQSIAADREELSAATEELKRNNAQVNSLNDIIVQSIKDVAASTEIIETQKLQADMQAQNATIEAITPFTEVARQRELLTELDEENQRINDLQDERTKIMTRDTGMPLLFDLIRNAFSAIPTDIAIKSAKAERSQTRQQIADMAAASEHINQINIKNRKILTDGVIQANAERTRALAEGEVAKAKLQGISTNAAHLYKVMQFNDMQTDKLVQLYGLKNQQFKNETDRERTELDIKQQKLLIQTYQSNLKKAEFREETVTHIEEAVNAGRAMHGLAPYPKGVALQMFEQGTPEQRLQAEEYIRLGTLAYDEATGTPPIATNPYEAKRSINIADPGGQGIQSKGRSVLAAIEDRTNKALATDPNFDPRNEDAIRARFNEEARKFQEEKAANIASGDLSNPYHAPDFQTIAERLKGKNKLYDEVLTDMEMRETNPQTIVEATTAAVLEGKIPFEQAVSNIKSIFDTAVVYNNSAEGGFSRYGLLNQTNYNTVLKRPRGPIESILTSPFRSVPSGTGLIKGGAKFSEKSLEKVLGTIDPYKIDVDLTNSTSIRNALSKFLSVQKELERANSYPFPENNR